MYGPPLEPIALEDLERVIGGSRTAVIGSNWAIDAMLASFDTGGSSSGLGMPRGDLIDDLYGHPGGATEAPMYLEDDDLAFDDLDLDGYDPARYG
jgi:hypothetical protein